MKRNQTEHGTAGRKVSTGSEGTHPPNPEDTQMSRFEAWLRSLSTPPKSVSEPESVSEQSRKLYMLNVVLFTLGGGAAFFSLAAAILATLDLAPWTGALMGVGLLPFYGVAYWLGRQRKVRAASFVPPVVLFIVMTVATYAVGIGHLTMLGYVMAAVIATLLCGRWIGLTFAVLGSTSYVLLGYLQERGISLLPIRVAVHVPTAMTALDGVAFILGTGVIVLFIWAFGREFKRLADNYKISEKQARELAENMEDAVAERTHALQQANLSFQRRAMYLEASVRVSQTLAALFELDPLLEQAVNLITQYFGFYHTGIFLIDEAGEWAILRAASSKGGREMLAAGHRLRRGEDSMVGWVMEYRQARIAADVGEDAHHFVNPYLPATRSEATLPMIAAGHLIGLLDVQSTEESAFDQDDVRALEGLAGQLAVAVNNAMRLREEATLLEAASPFYRLARRLATAHTERDVYAAMLDTVRNYSPSRAFVLSWRPGAAEHSYRKGPRIVADMQAGRVAFPEQEITVDALMPHRHLEDASAKNLPAELEDVWLINDLSDFPKDIPQAYHEQLLALGESSGARSLALIPVRAETQPLGALVVSYQTLHRFSPVEQQLYRALADLVGVALERTQLVQHAQLRAEQEHQLRIFSEDLMRIPDLQLVVEQAAHSLQELVRADGVMIALGTRSEKEEDRDE